MTVTTLLLSRHGEADFNRDGRFNGRTDESRLTDKGKEQARRLGERLKTEEIDVAYSSPSTRTQDTLRIALPNRDILIDERLVERDFGSLDGTFHEEFRKRHPALHGQRPYIIEFPEQYDVEAFDALQQRAFAVMNDIVRKHRGKTIMVMTHGVLLRALVSRVGKIDISREQVIIENCSLTTLENNDGHFVIKVLNDVSHLEGL